MVENEYKKPKRVLDLGAGTGLLSYWENQLTESGLTEYNIELWKERRKLDKECSVEEEIEMLCKSKFRIIKCVYSCQKFSGTGANLSIQELERRIVTEWLPTSGYEYANAPDIEVYLNPDPTFKATGFLIQRVIQRCSESRTLVKSRI